MHFMKILDKNLLMYLALATLCGAGATQCGGNGKKAASPLTNQPRPLVGTQETGSAASAASSDALADTEPSAELQSGSDSKDEDPDANAEAVEQPKDDLTQLKELCEKMQKLNVAIVTYQATPGIDMKNLQGMNKDLFYSLYGMVYQAYTQEEALLKVYLELKPKIEADKSASDFAEKEQAIKQFCEEYKKLDDTYKEIKSAFDSRNTMGPPPQPDATKIAAAKAILVQAEEVFHMQFAELFKKVSQCASIFLASDCGCKSAIQANWRELRSSAKKYQDKIKVKESVSGAQTEFSTFLKTCKETHCYFHRLEPEKDSDSLYTNFMGNCMGLALQDSIQTIMSLHSSLQAMLVGANTNFEKSLQVVAEAEKYKAYVEEFKVKVINLQSSLLKLKTDIQLSKNKKELDQKSENMEASIAQGKKVLAQKSQEMLDDMRAQVTQLLKVMIKQETDFYDKNQLSKLLIEALNTTEAKALYEEIKIFKEPTSQHKNTQLNQWLYSCKAQLQKTDLEADLLEKINQNLILISGILPTAIQAVLEEQHKRALDTMQKKINQEEMQFRNLFIPCLEAEIGRLKEVILQKRDLEIRAQFVIEFLKKLIKKRTLYELIKDKNDRFKESNMDGLTQFLTQKEHELEGTLTLDELKAIHQDLNAIKDAMSKVNGY